MRYFLVFAVTLFLVSCTPHQGRYMLINEASESLVSVKIKVCDQNTEFDNLKVASSVGGDFKVTDDGSYHIEVKFASGRTMTRLVGYVKKGSDFSHEITITDYDIQIK